MDIKTIQPSLDALDAQIASIKKERETLLRLVTPSNVNTKKPTVSKGPTEAQRKRWAESKRKQRAAAKKGTK